MKVFGTSDRSGDHYSTQTEHRFQALNEITEDLVALEAFGVKWKVTFEPTKTHAMLISNTRDCFYPMISQLVFCGKHIVFEEVLLLVGFLFDRKLTWKPMVDRVASKSRQALGAVFRLKRLLRPCDIAVLYKAFVRSVLEYGLLEYFAAAPGYLSKLDKVQRVAQRMCGIEFTALGDRREAAAFGLICKLLAGDCVEQLQMQCPVLDTEIRVQPGPVTRRRGKESTSSELDSQDGVPRLKEQKRFRVNTFKRSLSGQMATIFNKIPEDILSLGAEKGWNAAMKPGQRFLGGSKAKDVKLGNDEYYVERVIGTDEGPAGRIYLVVWKGYPGQDTWEKEANLRCARDSVVTFWSALGEPMPTSAVLDGKPKSKKQKHQKGTDNVAANKHAAQMNKDLRFRG